MSERQRIAAELRESADELDREPYQPARHVLDPVILRTAAQLLTADDAANGDCSHIWIRHGFSKTSVCKKCGATFADSSLSPDDPIFKKEG